MPDEERIEQLELEVKVLRDNNKGLKDKIDEQSKEIEELKAHQIIFTNDYKPIGSKGRKFISEDKIKAKIEELEKDLKEYENGQEWEIQDEIRGQIDILQSLLEKE